MSDYYINQQLWVKMFLQEQTENDFLLSVRHIIELKPIIRYVWDGDIYNFMKKDFVCFGDPVYE